MDNFIKDFTNYINLHDKLQGSICGKGWYMEGTGRLGGRSNKESEHVSRGVELVSLR